MELARVKGKKKILIVCFTLRFQKREKSYNPIHHTLNKRIINERDIFWVQHELILHCCPARLLNDRTFFNCAMCQLRRHKEKLLKSQKRDPWKWSCLGGKDWPGFLIRRFLKIAISILLTKNRNCFLNCWKSFLNKFYEECGEFCGEYVNLSVVNSIEWNFNRSVSIF